ncbi:MAG: DUF4256 domain-containing protein [Microgenomates group bacterium]
MEQKKELAIEQINELLTTLETRFEKNMVRHEGLVWSNVRAKLEKNSGKLWSLNEMERTGGEPDVIGFNAQSNEYLFCDCSEQSPALRRSLCYDNDALALRKEFKPSGSAVTVVQEMGIELLTEEVYRALQKLGEFDTKTSSWIKTPESIRKLGGACFADRRYDTVFVYHNGAESYYASRGFRGLLRV